MKTKVTTQLPDLEVCQVEDAVTPTMIEATEGEDATIHLVLSPVKTEVITVEPTVEDINKKLSATVGFLSLTIMFFNNEQQKQKNLIYFL